MLSYMITARRLNAMQEYNDWEMFDDAGNLAVTQNFTKSPVFGVKSNYWNL